ncbi:MAG: hypothetical protein NVSMB52_03090 [Chloroflexota bacterium]
MTQDSEGDQEQKVADYAAKGPGIALALVLGVVAAVGAGLLIQQILERRLSKPELMRLRFYRYLREHGHLES